MWPGLLVSCGSCLISVPALFLHGRHPFGASVTGLVLAGVGIVFIIRYLIVRSTRRAPAVTR